MAFIENWLAYERNNLTSSLSFLQLYISLVHMQQTAYQQFLVCNQSLKIQKDNGMAAMLDDKTKRSVIQHGCHTIVFLISRDWLQTKNNNNNVIQRVNYFLMLICWNRGNFFLIFLSPRAKLLTPDWSSGENSRSRLGEHASSTLRWFLYFEVLSSSLELDCLSQVVCTAIARISSAAARKKTPKR